MDRRFHIIYQELIELYRASLATGSRFPFLERRIRSEASLKSLAIVTEAVDQAVSSLEGKYSLRADAYLFLIVNIHQMVALPLAQHDSPVVLNDEIEQGIRRDTETIIRMAAESAGDRHDIPASHVLWGASKVLNELNLKSWRIWDRD
ncbi:hypothetical protein [Aliidiomarina soli]|uniref:Uncharacterized protein n=1 Tax=Aliidiomarina soli TaxID=1928574 RepID=A0A432WM32_9GAMM|nr:hypothetical protein [Aliidiomarina soli]RUO34882.1 hypothetical protein CWE14_02470 [Aliidiomarina soli]